MPTSVPDCSTSGWASSPSAPTRSRSSAAGSYREALVLAREASLVPLIVAILVSVSELLVLALRQPSADHETSERAQALLLVHEQQLTSVAPKLASEPLTLPSLDVVVARTLAELAAWSSRDPSPRLLRHPSWLPPQHTAEEGLDVLHKRLWPLPVRAVADPGVQLQLRVPKLRG